MGTCGRVREVLHFVSTFEVKTDTKWLVQLARHLDRERFHLSAACFYAGGPMQGQLEAEGIRTVNLESPHESDPRAILRAKRLINDVHPDIVHTHLLRADLLGGMAARWAGVPVILSTVCAMGEFRRERRRRTDSLLDMACAALPTHFLAVSHAVKQDCIKRLNMNPEDITVIHTGIDPPAPSTAGAPHRAELRGRWQIGEDQPLIVTLARLSHEKGIGTLIDAAAILHRTNRQARFVVVGEGPDRPKLEVRIRGHDIPGIVKLVGFHEDIWPVLAAADLVCVPSISEGMPNALLEAMAAGLPIVATTVGGIPEAIEHEHNGLLVAPEQPRQLADAIQQLIDDRPWAGRLGAAARQTIEQRFLARDVAGRYAELYETLLARQGEKKHAGAYTDN